MRTPTYDNSLEVQLTDILCKLDENPIVCTNPIGASSYKGFTLANSEKAVHDFIRENLFDRFVAYIDSYKVDCINTYAVKTHFIPIIKPIVEQYGKAMDILHGSEIRNSWSKYFSDPLIPNAEYIFTKKAYQFFYNASSVQIFYLGKAREILTDHLNDLETAKPTPDPEYYFSILPKFKQRQYDILYDIHKNLKAEGYINCTPNGFINVFTTEKPKSFSWLTSQRSLTYMIKIMTGQLLVEKAKPSNAYITERYIHIYKKDGSLLKPKKLRHDSDPKAEVKAFLDHVIDSAISSYV